MLLGTIFQSVTAWQKLSAIPLKPKVAYKLLKYTRYVSNEHEIAEKQRVALIHEITGTKDGEDAKIEPGSSQFVEYAERFSEIMATEVKFEQVKLKLEDVVELLDDKPDALSVSDLALLEPFFEDYKGEGEKVPDAYEESCEQDPNCEVCDPGPGCAKEYEDCDTCKQKVKERCDRNCKEAIPVAAGEIS